MDSTTGAEEYLYQGVHKYIYHKKIIQGNSQNLALAKHDGKFNQRRNMAPEFK